MVRKIFNLALVAALISLGGYYAYLTYGQPAPCSAPITYRIGAVDQRFGVATTTFEKDISQAAAIWNTDAHRTLFAYDPNGRVSINLIYDTRQAATDEAKTLSSDIQSTTVVADSVKTQYVSLIGQYTAAKNNFESDLAAFNTSQAAYNAAVDYWNSRGGAPSKEYAALQSERTALDSQRATVESERTQVNSLASEINALIDKYNLLVDHINTNISTINNNGLTGTTFEEGVYIRDVSGERINIYQFENKTYYIRVIAHELGHALGLGHDSGPDSIMNPVNSGVGLALSAEDVAALKALCPAAQ